MMDMLAAGQVRHCGADGLEGLAGSIQVGSFDELPGDLAQGSPARRGIAREIGRLGLAQRRQGLLVPSQVVRSEGGGGIGGGEDQGLEQAIGGLVVGLGAGGDLGGAMTVVVAGGPDGGMGELRLTVEDQGRLGHDPVTLGKAAHHLGMGVTHAAKLDFLCPIAGAAWSLPAPAFRDPGPSMGGAGTPGIPPVLGGNPAAP